MYSCGPTAYDFAHIGNFRSFLAADLVRRFLEAVGRGSACDEHYRRGSHDGRFIGRWNGEDKMQVAARRLKEDKKSGRAPEGCVTNPDDPFAVAAYYRDAFLEDGRKLGLKVASSTRSASPALPGTFLR